MDARTELIRRKNRAFAALERADVALLRWRTSHSGQNYKPLPAGWSERRERLAAKYAAAVHTLETAHYG